MQIIYHRLSNAVTVAILILCLLMSLSAPVHAETVKVTDAESLANALYQRCEVIQADADAIDGYLTDVLTQYPALGFDFNGYEGEILGDTITMRMAYRDTEMLPVRYADSREALIALVTEAAVYCEDEVHIVMPASLREMDFAGAMTEAFSESVLARTMITGRSWEIWVNGYTDVMYVSLRMEYEVDTDLLLQRKQQTEDAALRLARSLYYDGAEDAVIALLAHDALINRCVYGDTAFTAAENHSAYGVLINGYAVCEGYAEAFQLMMQIAGVECLYVEGFASDGEASDGERHGWNMIFADDAYYHVDVTWDDPVSEDGEHHLLYDHFLVTDHVIGLTHTWDPSAYPVADGSQWSAQRAQQQLSLQSQPVAFTVDYTPLYSMDAIAAYEAKWAQVFAKQLPSEQGGDVPSIETTTPTETTITTTNTTVSGSHAEETTDRTTYVSAEDSDATTTITDRDDIPGKPSYWAVYLVSGMLLVILLGVLYAKFIH